MDLMVLSQENIPRPIQPFNVICKSNNKCYHIPYFSQEKLNHIHWFSFGDDLDACSVLVWQEAMFQKNTLKISFFGSHSSNSFLIDNFSKILLELTSFGTMKKLNPTPDLLHNKIFNLEVLRKKAYLLKKIGIVSITLLCALDLRDPQPLKQFTII